MYLKEIQLNLPYREKPEILHEIMTQYNCTYEEAITIDYDNNWMIPIVRRFELETRSIAAMFIRLLGKYKTKKCGKIIIDCIEKEQDIEYPCYKGSCAGIGLVKYQMDYVSFFSKSSYEKKQIVLQIIEQSLYAIVKEEELDLIPLEGVVNKIKELDYNNFYVFGKKSKSPSKEYTAELYIEHEIDTIDFFAMIRNKQDEIIEKKLIVKEKPSEWLYMEYMGKLVWASDTEINLCDKTGFSLVTVSL